MKRKLISLLVFVCFTGVAFADGPITAVGVTPVSEQHGNRWQAITVPFSSNTAVLLSSAPENAVWRESQKAGTKVYRKGTNLGISEWRFREIVNNSNGGLLLMPTSTYYSVYCATCGINLNDGTDQQGDSYGDEGQGEIWGLWAPDTTTGGAGGSEHFYLK